jgi:hypothetical protein
MSLFIAGIDLFGQSLNNEYRIAVLEGILNHIFDANPNLISEDAIKEIRENALTRLQTKYPEAGITGGSSK